MIDNPLRVLLLLLLFCISLVSAVGPERAWADEILSQVQTSRAPSSADVPVEDNEIDALVEQLRLGGEPEILAKIEALAAMENRRALHWLGELYAHGPLPIDGVKAVNYYTRAVAAGEKNDIIRLADIYRDGKVIAADPEKAMEYYRKAADMGNSTGQLRLGNALIKGTLGQTDTAQGLTILEALADKNNRLALYDLGELYSKGALTIDEKKAISYYERALSAGHGAAAARLGDLYRDGDVIAADPMKAMDYYQQAADMGNSTGQLRLGNALIKGNLGQTDTARGLSLLEDLAQKDNRWALYDLGELYSKGPLPIDGIKAAAYYERAATAGIVSTLVRLGDIYRDGLLVESDPVKAISFYEEAYAAGMSSGLRNLALGHVLNRFGRFSQPDKGVNFLLDAFNAGDMSVATTLANAYFNGISVPKDVPRGLRVLSFAAEEGSPDAVQNLISLFRNGKGKDIPRDLVKADELLQKYSAVLGQNDLNLQQILLNAARADSPKEFAAVAADINKEPLLAKQRILPMVRSSNQNAYTWLLQERLAELGFYKGRLNGIMNTSTIRAVSAFCAQQNLRAECVQGPLHWATASVLGGNLYK